MGGLTRKCDWPRERLFQEPVGIVVVISDATGTSEPTGPVRWAITSSGIILPRPYSDARETIGFNQE
jgi:hypothetical protein